MKTLVENLTLRKMMEQARTTYDKTEERLANIESMMDRRLGGKTRVSMIFGILFTLVWGAAFACAFYGVVHIDELLPDLDAGYLLHGKIGGIAALCAGGASVLLVVVMVLDALLRTRYYGAILSAKSHVSDMRNRVALGKAALNGNLETFLKRHSDGYRQPLAAGASILEDADRVERQVAGMESLREGFLAGLKTVLYHAVCLLWTVVGCMALYQFLYGLANDLLFDGELTWKLARIVLIVFTVITCIIEFVISRAAWSGADCDVNNWTLFAVLPGPILFALLIAVAALAIFLVVLALQIVVGLIGIFFAGSIVFGMTSGG